MRSFDFLRRMGALPPPYLASTCPRFAPRSPRSRACCWSRSNSAIRRATRRSEVPLLRLQLAWVRAKLCSSSGPCSAKGTTWSTSSCSWCAGSIARSQMKHRPDWLSSRRASSAWRSPGVRAAKKWECIVMLAGLDSCRVDTAGRCVKELMASNLAKGRGRWTRRQRMCRRTRMRGRPRELPTRGGLYHVVRAAGSGIRHASGNQTPLTMPGSTACGDWLDWWPPFDAFFSRRGSCRVSGAVAR